MIMNKITDMAIELCQDIDSSFPGVSMDIVEGKGFARTIVRVETSKGAKKIGRPKGIYCDIEIRNRENVEDIIDCFSHSLGEFLRDTCVDIKKILVIGLGNNRFVVDSLGKSVCDLLNTGERVATFCPSVEAETGIPSVHSIKAITSLVKPSHIVVVDSLCCHEKSRLATSLQISNTGIVPGSGIGRNNQSLDKEFLGVPVIAVGVPLVIYLPSFHYVIPKTIDILVPSFAHIISQAINSSTFSQLND